jgi:hypothetical protein
VPVDERSECSFRPICAASHELLEQFFIAERPVHPAAEKRVEMPQNLARRFAWHGGAFSVVSISVSYTGVRDAGASIFLEGSETSAEIALSFESSIEIGKLNVRLE